MIDAITPLGAGTAPLPPETDGLRPSGSRDEAARRLEGHFVSMLFKEMRQAMTEEGLFGTGPGASIFEGIFDQMIAEDVTRGPGIGLREQILHNWPESGPVPGDGAPLPGGTAIDVAAENMGGVWSALIRNAEGGEATP